MGDVTFDLQAYSENARINKIDVTKNVTLTVKIISAEEPTGENNKTKKEGDNSMLIMGISSVIIIIIIVLMALFFLMKKKKKPVDGTTETHQSPPKTQIPATAQTTQPQQPQTTPTTPITSVSSPQPQVQPIVYAYAAQLQPTPVPQVAETIPITQTPEQPTNPDP